VHRSPISALALFCLLGSLICATLSAQVADSSQPDTHSTDPLIQILITKGILTPAEARNLGKGDAAEQHAQLLKVLREKGVISATDYDSLTGSSSKTPPASSQVSGVLVASTTPMVPSAVSSSSAALPQVAPKPETPKPTGPTVVPAVAPIRVLPVDPPVKDGLKAAFTLGPVKMTPYGFLKATGVYDTSNPNGDDMPFPGLFLSSTSITNTGPTTNPEFHLKARSSRIGSNFEFADVSPKLTITGRIEGDFEGNFSEVDNRDVSSLRSSMFSFRQAWGRLDYAANEKTDIYFEGGQDWTLFGSSALPNILETTALGYWYGDIYERSPQFQFGLIQKLGGSRNFKLAPTFAIMMPSTGQIEKLGSLGLQGQIAQAEREGADSGRPELEARVVFQFQADKAPGVASAQIFWSGFDARRTSVVTSSAYAATAATASCAANPILCAAYQKAYPSGFTASSSLYGNQIGLQLPTRWATLVATGYFGGDLRFFFGGQVNSFYTDAGGLSNPITFQSVTGGPLVAAGAPTLGTNSSGQIVVAPEKPIRAFGGFVNLGLPISRWFNANPKGRNAGWTLYLHAGKDQVVHNELTNPNGGGVANTLSPLPLLMGKLTAATLYYKLNPFVTFGIEQSIYATRLEPGATYTVAGKPSNEWQDHRTEFGPIFTF
jgi:hypothetical protein